MEQLASDKAIAEMKTMAVDMLKYGAAAQINFEYDVENLASNALSEEQLALGTQEAPEAADYQTVTGNGANVSAAIMVGSKVELSLSSIITGLADPAAVKCVIADSEGKVIAELATNNMATVMFSAKYDNVGAREMRKVINAYFVDGSGNAVSKTLSWSVESYVAQTRANEKSTEAQIAVAEAMLVYGDSVAAYLTATNQ